MNSTRVVGQAIAQTINAPRVWLQASTATLYAHRFDAPNDEQTGIIDGPIPNGPKAPDTWRFSIDVVKKWEREFTKPRAKTEVLMRLLAIVMSQPTAGRSTCFALGAVGLGAAGSRARLSHGFRWDWERQRLVEKHEDLTDPVNIADPIPNQLEFTEGIRKALGNLVDCLPPKDAGTWAPRSSQRKRIELQSRACSRRGCVWIHVKFLLAGAVADFAKVGGNT